MCPLLLPHLRQFNNLLLEPSLTYLFLINVPLLYTVVSHSALLHRDYLTLLYSCFYFLSLLPGSAFVHVVANYLKYSIPFSMPGWPLPIF